LLGEPIIQPSPSYPSSLRAAAISERDVCLELVIDEQGRVIGNPPLYDLPDCPQNSAVLERNFLQSAQETVMQWRFHPARLCSFADSKTAERDDGHCSGPGVRIEQLPVKLAFRFTFTQSLGGLKVDTARLSTDN
jgi:hypothetical protein